MPHLWYLCFMYGDLLWPDLYLEPSLISNIYSIRVMPYILGVLEVSFGPKLIILRSLRLVTWKPRFWLLTWPWPDTWPHLENLGRALGSSHRDLSNAAKKIGRLSAAIRSRVMTWGRLTPPPPLSKSRVAKYPSKCRVKVKNITSQLIDSEKKKSRIKKSNGIKVNRIESKMQEVKRDKSQNKWVNNR